MIKNPFAGFDFSNPFGTDAMKRSRNLFGVHTTPRDWKHGARDIPFGMGAASLHVDGTKGNDSNDGESWLTAKKTIQDTIDAADQWTQIFIKAGTYAENVTITDDSIHLIGQSRDSVDIHPASGNALTVSGDSVAITKLSLYSPTDVNTYCAVLSGENLIVDTIKLNGASGASGIRLTTPNHTILNNVYAANSRLSSGIYATGTAAYLTISNCIFNLTYTSPAYAIYLEKISKSKIFNNDIGALSGGYGIWIEPDCANLSIFHNNFLSNNVQVDDTSSKGTFFENFYSEHSNVDNGFGIAKAPYTFTTGTDPRPVVTRNGWLGLSWADADEVATDIADLITRTKGLDEIYGVRKRTAGQAEEGATDANGTEWVNLKEWAPTTDLELYRIKMTVAGSWAGTPEYRITIDSVKVYPFADDQNIDTGVIESFIFPLTVQSGKTLRVQFHSTNAGDGAGETVALNQLDYATVL